MPQQKPRSDAQRSTPRSAPREGVDEGVDRTHRVIRDVPINAEARPDALASPITRTERFFVRRNFAPPELGAETHHILVAGAVDRKVRLGLGALRSLGAHGVTMTLECAGNDRASMVPLPAGEPWCGGAIGTAEWAGVPLARVLEAAGVRPAAIEILVEGADRGAPPGSAVAIPFARSLPLDKAMHADTILALEMNGVPLPPGYGGPVRLIVPGWYGMASVKWVSGIRALTEPFQGHFQRERYMYEEPDRAAVPVTTVRVKSLIHSPSEGDPIRAGTVRVRGWAWSGEGEIARVEFSADGGERWGDAHPLDQPSPHAWRGWFYDWNVEEVGCHTLCSRATDTAGNVQPDRAPWNHHGYGNNAVRAVTVRVR
ncbi:sulfite oxidase [soil metagenome]